MSKQPTEEEIVKWQRFGSEFFNFIRQFFAKCYTIQDVLEVVTLLHSHVTEEGLRRAAVLGQAKQQFIQMLDEEIKRRKMKDMGVR